ncbi:MAG: TonB-dependent receptor [Ferruginibacter sp.]
MYPCSHKYFLIAFVLLGLTISCIAQIKDTPLVTTLKEVSVVGFKTMNGTGHFNEVNGAVIYAGKKTEVIEVDSIDANKAINNTRQILGRIPGLYIVESETGGFVANGIGLRGLNPVQSLEMNVRQNGYNVAADVYGYNETYYLPPMEAVARVELVKGAASIQFGSQMGGMVNYVLKEADPVKSFTYNTMQTAGSDGLFNTYHEAGGSIKKWTWFTFINCRALAGWRPNSQQQQLTGFGKISYQPNQKTSVGIEYSLLRNKIKMPGGLADDQFDTDNKASVRSRNWLKSPWNVVTALMDYSIHKNTSLHIKSTFLTGERSLVWFNKLPGEQDLMDPVTGQYAAREVDRELMKSWATELRLLHNYNLGKIKSTLATGIRFSIAGFDRKEEAPGTNAGNFDLSVTGEYEENYHFTTTNIAAFIEDCIQVNEYFSITPGIRFESLESEAEAEYEVNGIEKEQEKERTRSFVLTGIGLQYKNGKALGLYGNISQAYQPVDYAQLLPLGTVSKVDPNMKDPNGWNADLGIRGNIQNFFNYDISLFCLSYNNRIGLINKKDETGVEYTLRTNVDKSIHRGIESYVELNITRALQVNKTIGDLGVYNSFAYTRARYVKGAYKGNQVEYAPEVINRIGITYTKNRFTTSLQFSHQSKAYGDAANTERSSNPIVGRIPGYSVVDWSVLMRFKKLKFKAGINNLADKRYFTQRTDEYPGPGIIPSTGRSFYTGVGYNL